MLDSVPLRVRMLVNHNRAGMVEPVEGVFKGKEADVKVYFVPENTVGDLTGHYDVVVLVGGSGESSSLSILKAIRSRGISTPVLLVGDTWNEVPDLGVYSCIPGRLSGTAWRAKVPFLLLRALSGVNTIKKGSLIADLKHDTISIAGNLVPFAPAQRAALAYLMWRDGIVVRKYDLARWVACGTKIPHKSSAVPLVSKIRVRLEEAGLHVLGSVYGQGFVFRAG